MGVYIKGLKLPSAERQLELLILTDDGRCVDMFNREYEAVELQPHGRLIDADALTTYPKPIRKLMMFGGEHVYTQTAIDDAPTIIEADGE